MKKILFSILVITLALSMVSVFSLIGCGTTTASETTAAAGEAVKMPGFEGQKLVVRTDPDAMMNNGKTRTTEFEKAYGVTVDYTETGWEVNWTKFPQMLATDEPVDVLTLLNAFWYEYPDKITVLNDVFPEMFSEMIPELVKYATVNGKIYGVPYLPSYEIFFYNTEIFKSANISKVPETWDDFKVSLKKLNDFNKQYNFVAAWGLKDFWQFYTMWMKSAGKNTFDITETGIKWNIDSPESIATIKYMKSLLDEDLVSKSVLSETEKELTARYSSGEIGLLLMWDTFTSFLDPKAIEFTKYFAVPGKEKGLTGSLDGHEYLGIPKAAPNPALAKEYIKWMCGKEFTTRRALEELIFPVYKSQLEDPKIIATIPYFDVTNYVKGSYAEQVAPVEKYYELRENAAAEWHKALLGEITVEEACATNQKNAETYKYIPPK